MHMSHTYVYHDFTQGGCWSGRKNEKVLLMIDLEVELSGDQGDGNDTQDSAVNDECIEKSSDQE